MKQLNDYEHKAVGMLAEIRNELANDQKKCLTENAEPNAIAEKIQSIEMIRRRIGALQMEIQDND